MKITEARVEISGGNEVVYVGAAADGTLLPDAPYLAISVVDFEEAQELIGTIERSRAQKKREPTAKDKPTPPTESAQRAGEIAARLGGTNASGEKVAG